MSVNSRYRERKYNSSENDRLLRILSQPVQSWEKKWAPSSRSKSYHIHKWVKSDRTIVFEDEEDDEDEEEDKDQVMTEADKDTLLTSSHESANTTTQHQGNLATTTETGTKDESTMIVDNDVTGMQNTGLFTTHSPLTNKQVSSAAADEERTHTPKLSDVPDVDPDQMMADDDKESNADDLNDPSRHPAYAPHIHPRLTDDEALGTTSQSEQTSTEATPKDNNDFGITTSTTINTDLDTSNNIESPATTTLPTTSSPNITETNTTINPVSSNSAPASGDAVSNDSMTTEPAIITTVENEPSLVTSPAPAPAPAPASASASTPAPQDQEQQTQPPKGTMEVDDRLLDAPVKTPDVVSSTNTPGVDTPFDTDTPSDMPMQRNINVVTENDTDMDLTPTDPQANDEPAQ